MAFTYSHLKETFAVKKLTSLIMALMMLALLAAPALAQQEGSAEGETAAENGEAPRTYTVVELHETIGLALIIFGSAYGIGKIGASAVESMARQPEVAGNIQTAMIVSAALIEGATLLAVIVCLLALL